MKVFYKPMKDYGYTTLSTGNIFIDPKKFHGKVAGLDTILHEKLHSRNRTMSEKDVRIETKKQMKSYLSII